MTAQTWKLLDASDGTFLEDLVLGPKDAGGSATDYEVSTRRYRGGLREGVAAIRVSSGGGFAFDLLPTRGMGIWKAWLHGEEIGWRSPVHGPVHPAFVPLAEPSGLGWLDGFDELLVRCGLESNGAPDFDAHGKLRFPLHGRIANRPAHKVSVAIDGQRGEIAVTGEVDESRFLFAKLRLTTTVTTFVGEPRLRIRDVVENRSDTPAEIQMLYHINLGLPLLDAGSRFIAPVKAVVPRNGRAADGIAAWDRYADATPGFEEQVYFLELLAEPDGSTRALLKNSRSSRGASVAFNSQQLPCFTLWKHTAGTADGYVTGLEPATNFPNPRTFEAERGRLVRLDPHGKTAFEFELAFHDQASEIAEAERAIARLQSDRQPEIFQQPRDGWCAP